MQFKLCAEAPTSLRLALAAVLLPLASFMVAVNLRPMSLIARNHKQPICLQRKNIVIAIIISQVKATPSPSPSSSSSSSWPSFSSSSSSAWSSTVTATSTWSRQYLIVGRPVSFYCLSLCYGAKQNCCVPVRAPFRCDCDSICFGLLCVHLQILAITLMYDRNREVFSIVKVFLFVSSPYAKWPLRLPLPSGLNQRRRLTCWISRWPSSEQIHSLIHWTNWLTDDADREADRQTMMIASDQVFFLR